MNVSNERGMDLCLINWTYFTFTFFSIIRTSVSNSILYPVSNASFAMVRIVNMKERKLSKAARILSKDTIKEIRTNNKVHKTQIDRTSHYLTNAPLELITGSAHFFPRRQCCKSIYSNVLFCFDQI